MNKNLHEFSEEEIITVVNQLPIYIGQWMREVGIRQISDFNEGERIYESLKQVMMEQWAKARDLHGEIA
ncbi:MAG: hypothetical protein RQ824_01995 [bacterium]|nr:hypothetical protein [bacterium]